MTQAEKIARFFIENTVITKSDIATVLNIGLQRFQNLVSELRADGYDIKCKKGEYVYGGHTIRKKPALSNEYYITKRMKLIPEAEKVADTHEDKNTAAWDRLFCTTMAELATKHLGCKESWQ